MFAHLALWLLVLPWLCYWALICLASLVPRPHPAFRRLQYGKAGRAWYLFSCEHDVISKLRKFAELTGCVSRISTNYALNAQCVRQSPPASQIRVVSYLVPWLFSLFWAQCAHAKSNPFYHPFNPDVTHVRKDTRPSPLFTVLKATESWAGPGNEATVWLLFNPCHT